MKQSRIRVAKPRIIAFFNNHPQKAFSLLQLEQILETHRMVWNPAQTTDAEKFAQFLCEEGILSPVRFAFPRRPVTLYARGEPSPWELAQALAPKGYLSHRSAMELQNLVRKPANIFYVNQEQTGSSTLSGELSQESIDSAFSNPGRISTDIAQAGDFRFCRLNGKNTGLLGVVSVEVKDAPALSVTNRERTLIDITVRPAYAGGPQEVLHAYQLASPDISSHQLAAMLEQIAHIYPYHQAIGFYLEQSGCYSEEDLQLFQNFGLEYDFYLDYGMEEPLYSKSWRLYYPSDFPR